MTLPTRTVKCYVTHLMTGGGGFRAFQGDALVYDDYDEYNYFYLANPFNASVMAPFLMHLKESLSRNPRTIYVLYLLPILHNMFINEGFKVEKRLTFFTYPHECTVYSYDASVR